MKLIFATFVYILTRRASNSFLSCLKDKRNDVFDPNRLMLWQTHTLELPVPRWRAESQIWKKQYLSPHKTANKALTLTGAFFFIYSVCIQPVFHQSVYHGIFTVVFFCYVMLLVVYFICSLGVVTVSGHFSTVPVACLNVSLTVHHELTILKIPTWCT